MSGQFFDSEQEKDALAYALAKVDHCGEAMRKLQIDLLEDTRHQRIWEAGRHYYHQYGGVLDRAGLQAMLNTNEVPQDKQVMYLTLLDDIKRRVITQDRFRVALGVLDTLRFKRGLYDMVNGAAAHLERGSLDKQKICNDIVNNILNLQRGEDAVVREQSYKLGVESRIALYKDRKEHPEKYRGIPYGIQKLDELTGGMYSGEFIIFFGRPGAGKSQTLHNIAYAGAEKGFNSLYVTIEMPNEQVGRRLDSRHLQISARGLRNASLNAVEEKKFLGTIKNGLNLKGDIHLVDMPQGCSVAQLLPILRRHLMEPTRWSNSKVERTTDIARELKQLARLEGIPVLTAARATREAAKTESGDMGTEHLSWSDALGYDADQIVYIKKGTSISALEAEVEGIVVKFRDGSNETFKLGVNWDKSYVGDIEHVLASVKSNIQTNL
jgi:replicative DNA helicase